MQHADLSRGSLAESAGLSRMSLAESIHLDLRKNGPKRRRNKYRKEDQVRATISDCTEVR